MGGRYKGSALHELHVTNSYSGQSCVCVSLFVYATYNKDLIPNEWVNSMGDKVESSSLYTGTE